METQFRMGEKMMIERTKLLRYICEVGASYGVAG